MSNSKDATLKAIIDSVLTDLMVKTTGTQIYLDDSTTLSSKIAEMVAAINIRAKNSDVDNKLSEFKTTHDNDIAEVTKSINSRPTQDDVTAQIGNLKQEIMGDLPVEAYDTFTEMAAYITEHQEVAEALTAAVGNKADKSVVDDILKTIGALGDLSTKSKVSKSDLDASLQTELDAKATSEDMEVALSAKAPTEHTHDDRYYTETEIQQMLSGFSEEMTEELLNKAPTEHTHDDRYYTETEIDAKLAGLSGSGGSGSSGVGWGVCETASATAAKVVTITNNDNWELKLGSEIIVKFTMDNAASNITLNVNNTGAKPVWYGGEVYTGLDGAICGMIGVYIRYVYDGTHWVWMGHSYDANDWQVFKGATATKAATPGFLPVAAAGSQDKFFKADGTWEIPTDTNNHALAICETAAGTAAKVATITGNDNWKLAVGSEVIVKFTNINTASNCTLNVDNTGAKSVWYDKGKYAGASTTVFGYTGSYIRYVYDGTYWVWMGKSGDSNTWNPLKGATTSVAGTAGYAPAPTAGAVNRFLRSDATWALIPDSNSVAYGECATAATTAEKVVNITSDDDWTLKVGSEIMVKFGITNEASNVTLNVNNTGAKSIWYNDSVYSGNYPTVTGFANRYIKYTYDGTQWVWSGDSGGAMDSVDPVGTGAFSMNRKADTTVGYCSFAEGSDTEASGHYSHAEGDETKASGNSSHAEGYGTEASGYYSHAEGFDSEASGDSSHAEGWTCKARGAYSHASGYYTSTTKSCQFAIGFGNKPQDDSIFEVGNGKTSDGKPAIGNKYPAETQNAFRVNQSGQAIAQTGLGIGETIITEDQLKYLSNVGQDGHTNNGSFRFYYNSEVNANAYNVANVVALANPVANSVARAGYGFNNVSKNGMFLYLDTVDSLLRMMDNNGTDAVRFGGDEIVLKTTTQVKCYGTSLKSQNVDGSGWAPVYASAFTQQSSRKYKKNFENISEEDANKLLLLHPVKYDYINEEDGTDCYGLIAEEVNTIMSYPVVYDSEGNPDGIDYSKFVPYLIKMVQMQNEKINKLEEQNASLTQWANELGRRLTILEQLNKEI